jgi:formamidopyrimidine-DNA glycosylase
MPELPEVETIARFLREGGREQPLLLGRRILESNLLWERTLAEPAPAEFKQRLVGQVIEDIGRRGKFLYFRLTNDWLLVHLRMSGPVGEVCRHPSRTSRSVAA